jgi:hypothetical protein
MKVYFDKNSFLGTKSMVSNLNPKNNMKRRAMVKNVNHEKNKKKRVMSRGMN